MTRRYAQVDEQRLAEALKSEASRHTPAHSEMLHARIMQRIQTTSAASDPQLLSSPSPGTPGEGRGEGSAQRAQPVKSTVVSSPVDPSRRVRSEATARITPAPSIGPAEPKNPDLRLTYWRWIPLAAAAAIVLGLWLWSSRSTGPGTHAPAPRVIARDTRPTIPAVDEICERVAANAYDRLETQLKERQLAYLDDDARRLAHFVLDCTTPLPLQKR